MKVGATRGKTIMLAGLLVFGGYLFYSNVIADSSDHPRTTPSAPKPSGALAAQNKAINGIFDAEPTAAPKGPVVRAKSKASEEFHPSMQRKAEDAVDPKDIDPTLRLDLLAKVQAVPFEGGGRNPFQFGAAPPPPTQQAKVDVAAIKNAMKPTPPPTPPPPTKPMTPVLNLSWKYYGYSSQRASGQKKAFFLDGEDIMTANEGDILKKKYRIVRIGVNSVVVEDTDNKTQQTLPLQEEAQG